LDSNIGNIGKIDNFERLLLRNEIVLSDG